MEMHFLDRHLMDVRLRLPEALEHRLRAIAAGGGECRAIDQREDLRKAPVRMRVTVPRRVVMVMAAAVVVSTMLVPVVVCGRPVRVLVDGELRRRHARAQHLPRVDVRVAERETPQRALEIGKRQAGVEQRPERHVARDPREAVEIEHATHRPLASMKL